MIGNWVVVVREPSGPEDPDGVWLEDMDELVGSRGQVVDDGYPIAMDSIYVLVNFPEYDSFYVPLGILSVE